LCLLEYDVLTLDSRVTLGTKKIIMKVRFGTNTTKACRKKLDFDSFLGSVDANGQRTGWTGGSKNSQLASYVAALSALLIFIGVLFYGTEDSRAWGTPESSRFRSQDVAYVWKEGKGMGSLVDLGDYDQENLHETDWKGNYDDFGVGEDAGLINNKTAEEDIYEVEDISKKPLKHGKTPLKQGKTPGGYTEAMKVYVVIGPTKTASTHEKQFLAGHTDYLQKHNWIWPRSPISKFRPGRWNDFMELPYLMKNKRYWALHKNKSGVSAKEQIQWYKKEFSRVRSLGSNMIFGSEHFMCLSTIEKKDNINAIKEFHSLMPWKPNETSSLSSPYSLTALINYRKPRVSHIKSLYKQQVNSQQKEKRPFSEWLCENTELVKRLNTPGHAEVWLKGGTNVAIIDMEETFSEGRDVIDVLLCDIMSIKCNNLTNMPINITREVITKSNHALSAKFDVGDNVFDRIEKILLRADCHHAKFLFKALNEGKFTIYPHSKYFVDCKESGSIDEEKLVSQILLIPGLNCKKNK